MSHDTRLAEMLCTRLCHDLTGPIGAVHNGAEFLEEDGFDMHHEALKLITSSAHEVVHRLQFYRSAYGRVNDAGEACLEDKRSVAQQFFSGTKVTLDWPETHADASGVSVGQKTARLMLNLMIILGHSLIRGGTLSVRLDASASEKMIHLVAEGAVVKLDPDVQRILLHEGTLPLTPKTVQAVLTMNIAEEVGAALLFDFQANRLACCVRQPQLAYAASHS